MTSAQPSTRTNSSSLNGSDTITGGIIIMPSAISAPLTTMSMTRNGMKMMKPMMKACLQLGEHERRDQRRSSTPRRGCPAARWSATLVSSASSSSSVWSSMNVAQRLDAVLERLRTVDLSPSR